MKKIIVGSLIDNICFDNSQKKLTVLADNPFSGNDCIDFLFLN